MQFPKEGIFSTVLAKSEIYNYTLMCLAAGSDIDEHTSTKNGVVQVLKGKGNFGYNAASEEYGDMLKMGILDPTKVSRAALQHAASISGLMITTEAMITDKPQDSAPAMPDMGGMGGMGGMGF